MNPALCVLTMAVGGMLVVGAVLGYVTGWLGTGAAVALGVVGMVVDGAGTLMLVASRRGGAPGRRS